MLMQALFGLQTPPSPRNDLVTIFLTGISRVEPDRHEPATLGNAETQHGHRADSASEPARRAGGRYGQVSRMGDASATTSWILRCRRWLGDATHAGIPARPNNRLGDGVEGNDRPYWTCSRSLPCRMPDGNRRPSPRLTSSHEWLICPGS